MAMTENQNEKRDEIEALLPWYATGKLATTDRTRVEEALAQSPELQASLRLIEQDREETVALNESLPSPAGDGWARIAAAISAEPRSRGAGSDVAFLANLLGLGPEPNRMRLVMIGAAAAIVIALQGAAIVALLPARTGAVYRTATAHSTAGAEALIAFVPDARISDVGAFLQERHGSIDEGPRGGMYRVRFGDRPLSHEEMNALIKDLSASPIVRLALPGGGE
jgi:anti-sigma factor RsiW